mgnify:CR=1 FL=1
MKNNLQSNNEKFILRYWFFNSLSKSIRSIITVLLLLCGFAIQLELSIFIGSILIIAASLLNIVRGINIKKPDAKKTEWEKATFSEINNILVKIKEIKKWSSLSLKTKITILYIYGFFSIPFIIAVLARYQFITIIFLDFNFLFIPLFLSGNRSVWIPPHIEIKVNTFLDCMQHPRIKNNPEIKIQPYILVGKLQNQSNFPLDVKLMIEFPKFSKDFLGIQIQVSINKVGTSNYPYVYAVLIAKQSLALNMKSTGYKKIIHEYHKQDEMDILVIRRYTTKTLGYHTDKKTIQEIIDNAFNTTENLLISINKSY